MKFEAVLFDMNGVLLDDEASYRRRELITFPGVVELIKSLKAAGLKLGLVTGGWSEEAHAVIDGFELAGYFDVVVTAEDTRRYKPNPDGYLLAARLLGLNPGKCIVVENTPSGIAAANSAGMVSVGVLTTHSVQELSAANFWCKQFGPKCLDPVLGA